ncbi:MAG: AAA family ATPase [Phycisphaerae bacterium]|nr:AAA family ATPase [Phycisphaerae bacterium]
MSAKNNRSNVNENIATHGNHTQSVGAFHPLQILVQRRWQLLACFLLVSCVALASLFITKPAYKATAQVKVTSESGPKSLFGGGRDQFNTYKEILKSRKVLDLAAENLGNENRDWAYSDTSIDLLKSQLEIQPVSGSDFINITGVSHDQTRATAIANNVAAAFVEISREQIISERENFKKMLDEQIVVIDQELADKQAKIKEYRDQHKVNDSGSDLRLSESHVTSLSNELAKTRTSRQDQKARLDYIDKIIKEGKYLADNNLKLDAIDKDIAIITIRKELDDLEKKEAQLSRVYLPGHDKLKEIRNQLTDTSNRLSKIRANALSNYYEQNRHEYSSILDYEVKLTKDLNLEREKNIALTDEHQGYQKLIKDLEYIIALRNETENSKRKLILDKSITSDPVEASEWAVVPTKASGLSPAHRAASILLVGLLFSIAFVIALDRFSDEPSEHIYNSEAQNAASAAPGYYAVPGGFVAPVAMNNMHGMNPGYQNYAFAGPNGFGGNMNMAAGPMASTLGHVGHIQFAGMSQQDMAFAARCRIVHTDPSSSEANAFRDIGIKLLSQSGNARQSLVVTGSSRYSGKTTCLTNLALMLAQSGRRVCIVDSNSEHALQRVFRLNNNKLDLKSINSNSVLSEEFISKTDVMNLDVIQLNLDIEPTDGQFQEAFSTLERQLHSKFDWVLYDGGTLSKASTQNLLRIVGKSLAVGNSNSSEVSVISSQIISCGAMVVGYVENNHVMENVNQTNTARSW